MKTRTFLPRRWHVVLIGLLAAMVLLVLELPAWLPSGCTFFICIDRFTNRQVAAIQIADFDKALALFKLDVGRYPTNAEGLQALVVKPADADGWDGPYMKGGVPIDPWNNPYHYNNPGPGGSVEIFSLGADNAPGGEGENADIRQVVKDDEGSR